MSPHSVAAMGNGSFVGEVQEGPNGELYEWVEGIDGFGNPLGFWKTIRILKSIGRTVAKHSRRPGRRTRSTGLRGGDYAGELRQGLDGQLYEWVEGVDGLGNPIGFWKAVKAVGKAAGKAWGTARHAVGKARGMATDEVVRRYLPEAAGLIPGIGPWAAEGVRAAQAAGLLGAEEDDWTT